MNKKLERFITAFDNGFKKPDIKVGAIYWLWVDLEIISDAMAGPLYSIKSKGQCNYVYNYKENRFPGVVNAETFNIWVNELMTKYKNAVYSYKPKGNEEDDLKVLSLLVENMLVACELAYQLQLEND